jgi:hypothetical protein
MKNLDGLGMKYTRWLFYFAALILAPVELPLLGQSSYLAPSGIALPAVSASSETEQAGSPILTIRKRVDEVNVLFIATDKHGKFVRNLNQGDFTILDDHQPPGDRSADRNGAAGGYQRFGSQPL